MRSPVLDGIKKYIPNHTKSQILSFFSSKEDLTMTQFAKKKKIFVFLAGYYQNLGDMALTYSQCRFLQENFPQYSVIPIASNDTYQKMNGIKYITTDEDIITILGGGNMDDLYTSLEDARRFVIQNFPNNKIISFPQTMAFSDTDFGRKRLKKSINTYSKNKNLIIFTREKKSLKLMNDAYIKNPIHFCPDMVLYLNEINPQIERKGIICCLRDDKEINLSADQHVHLKNMILRIYPQVIITDTVNVTLEQCKPANIEKTLKDFWHLLKGSKVVVTDRLHCMIFCAITKTPCVVLDNSNHKISGVYEAWLHNLEYIKMIYDFNINDINDSIDQLMQIDLSKCTDINLTKEFQVLINAIKQ